MSGIIILGILLAYINQVSPSPLLMTIGANFGINNNDALLNLSVSIIFPMVILASIAGTLIEQKIGTEGLFTWTMAALTTGMLTNFVAVNYYIFLLGRMLYGIGFGLGIPFIGSAIMKWYSPRGREIMNTVNGLFPFVGAVIGFSCIAPLHRVLGNSMKWTFGIWGLMSLIVMAAWMLIRRAGKGEGPAPVPTSGVKEHRLYSSLWRRRDIKLLCTMFACDFMCYAYISIVLPTYLMEAVGMPELSAGLWSAIAFSAVGILGGAAGGAIMAKTGRRKPCIAIAQAVKFIAIVGIWLGSFTSPALIIPSVMAFGIGNSLWTPGVYIVPTELEDMNPTRVGAAFSLITSFGFAFGFIAPVCGGWMTNAFMSLSSAVDPVRNHVSGVANSMLIFGFTNIIAFVCAIRIRETGPASGLLTGVRPKDEPVLDRN